MGVREGSQSSLPYRSMVEQAGPATPVTRDEEKYDTLKSVYNMLFDCVEGLYREFNAFEVGKNNPPGTRAKILLHEVEVKQGVFEIVKPLLDQVEGALEKADSNFKRRNS